MQVRAIYFRPLAFLAVLGFVASFALAKDNASSQTKAQELGNLQEAYDLLRIADHDYKGHRAKAMHAIESAAHEVGGEAGAHRRGHEAQVTSDEQLRQAQTLLESVSSMASQMDQTRLSEHVSHALNEIHTALNTK
ncbi:MAG TPA: hypothetical protein VGG19_13335 [Tepidisphaeraceae bacterium]|jgi:hypothetical protein